MLQFANFDRFVGKILRTQPQSQISRIFRLTKDKMQRLIKPNTILKALYITLNIIVGLLKRIANVL